jgi:hypothetical protein
MLRYVIKIRKTPIALRMANEWLIGTNTMQYMEWAEMPGRYILLFQNENDMIAFADYVTSNEDLNEIFEPN